MQLVLKASGFEIRPESEQDVAYIRDTLKMDKADATITGKLVCEKRFLADEPSAYHIEFST